MGIKMSALDNRIRLFIVQEATMTMPPARVIVEPNQNGKTVDPDILPHRN